MNSKELVEGMKDLFIDEAAESYKELYLAAESSVATDPYTSDIKTVMSSLDMAGKQALFSLIRMVCIDSATSFCSFLDGSCGYVGQDDNLILTPEGSLEMKLNGDLVMLLDRCLGNK